MIASTITIIAQPYLLHFCALVMLLPEKLLARNKELKCSLRLNRRTYVLLRKTLVNDRVTGDDLLRGVTVHVCLCACVMPLFH